MPPIPVSSTRIEDLPPSTVLKSGLPGDLQLLFEQLERLKDEEKENAVRVIVSVAIGKVTKWTVGPPFELNVETRPDPTPQLQSNEAARLTAARLEQEASLYLAERDTRQAIADAHAAAERAAVNQAAAGINGPQNREIAAKAAQAQAINAAAAQDAALRAGRAQRRAATLRASIVPPALPSKQFIKINPHPASSVLVAGLAGFGLASTGLAYVKSTNALAEQEAEIIKLQLLSGLDVKNVLKPTGAGGAANALIRDVVRLEETIRDNQFTGLVGTAAVEGGSEFQAARSFGAPQNAERTAAARRQLADLLGGLPPQFAPPAASDTVDVALSGNASPAAAGAAAAAFVEAGQQIAGRVVSTLSRGLGHVATLLQNGVDP